MSSITVPARVRFDDAFSVLDNARRGVIHLKVGFSSDCPAHNDVEGHSLLVTPDPEGFAVCECERGCEQEAIARFVSDFVNAPPPRPRRKRTTSRTPCVIEQPELPVEPEPVATEGASFEASPVDDGGLTEPETTEVSSVESRQVVKAVNDGDGDGDGSQKPINAGVSEPPEPEYDDGFADDGLPRTHLGALLRRFKDGTLNPREYGDDWITVPMKMPRGAALRSLAYWIRVCLELRLNSGETEPMGFSLSLGCTLLGLDRTNPGHRSNVSRDLHKLEERGVIYSPGTVKVPRRGPEGTEMRCFLPVGVDLEALLDEPLTEIRAA